MLATISVSRYTHYLSKCIIQNIQPTEAIFFFRQKVLHACSVLELERTCLVKQANSENLCPPPRIFLRNKESSENVKYIGGVTPTRYILSTYVDSNNY